MFERQTAVIRPLGDAVHAPGFERMENGCRVFLAGQHHGPHASQAVGVLVLAMEIVGADAPDRMGAFAVHILEQDLIPLMPRFRDGHRRGSVGCAS